MVQPSPEGFPRSGAPRDPILCALGEGAEVESIAPKRGPFPCVNALNVFSAGEVEGLHDAPLVKLQHGARILHDCVRVNVRAALPDGPKNGGHGEEVDAFYAAHARNSPTATGGGELLAWWASYDNDEPAAWDGLEDLPQGMSIVAQKIPGVLGRRPKLCAPHLVDSCSQHWVALNEPRRLESLGSAELPQQVRDGQAVSAYAGE